MTLVPIDDTAGNTVVQRMPQGTATAEQPLRDLIHAHPQILAVAELEPEIGRLIIVECKLWRNPQARREVVGQILDYARELARYAYDDLRRVISSRVGRRGNVLHDLARAAGSTMNEADFVDRVARDLAAGRFLLLIAGDGITEGTQRIGEYLGAQAGLAFDLGLIEIAKYRFDDPVTGEARRIVQPRLLARTATIDRFVIRSEIPGMVVDAIPDSPAPRGRNGGTGAEGGTAPATVPPPPALLRRTVFATASLLAFGLTIRHRCRRAMAATTGCGCPCPEPPVPRSIARATLAGWGRSCASMMQVAGHCSKNCWATVRQSRPSLLRQA